MLLVSLKLKRYLENLRMQNELQIKPLIEYEVTVQGPYEEEESQDIFTAESYECVNGTRYIFYRTGNIVREYNGFVKRIVATPAVKKELHQGEPGEIIRIEG
jgi:hypothetical protein